MLNRSANVNAQDSRGGTALFNACSFGHVDVMEFLLNNGTDPSIKDRLGYTALSRTIEGKKLGKSTIPDINKKQDKIIELLKQAHQKQWLKKIF